MWKKNSCESELKQQNTIYNALRLVMLPALQSLEEYLKDPVEYGWSSLVINDYYNIVI